MIPVDASTQQQVIVEAAACGVGSNQIAMEIGGGGDLYVTIKTKPLTDHQITCLSASERHPPHPILMFSDQDVSRPLLRITTPTRAG